VDISTAHISPYQIFHDFLQDGLLLLITARADWAATISFKATFKTCSHSVLIWKQNVFTMFENSQLS